MTEDFGEDAAWTQTTLFPLSLTSALKRQKKRKWKQKEVCHLEHVEFCVVSSYVPPPSPPHDPLLASKCCSWLRTLPGAHPVCEILTWEFVNLCSDEMMIHSFMKCIVHFIYLIFWFVLFCLFLKNGMHRFFGLILGVELKSSTRLMLRPQPTVRVPMNWSQSN